MGNTQELRFQGICLINDEGYKYMRCDYDSLPELVRDRLKSSSYNLCSRCVVNQALSQARRNPPTVPEYLKVIEAMEQQLKCQEAAVCEAF